MFEEVDDTQMRIMEIRSNVLGMYQTTNLGFDKFDPLTMCFINFLLILSAMICIVAMLNPFMSEITFQVEKIRDYTKIGAHC